MKLTTQVFRDGSASVFFDQHSKQSGGELFDPHSLRCSAGTHRYQVKATLNSITYLNQRATQTAYSSVLSCTG